MDKTDTGHCFWYLADGVNHCSAPTRYQLCGFYFCANHRADAEEKGATYWTKLYRAYWNV